MSKNVRNLLISLAVILLVSFAFSLLVPRGLAVYLVSMVAGGLTYYFLSAFGGTRKETQGSEADRQAALGAVPAPGGALLYVSRSGFVGKLIGLDLSIDGQTFAQLRSPRFTVISIAAGPHTLSARNGSGSFVNKAKEATATFHAVPGERVFFELSFDMGMLAGSLSLIQRPAEPQLFGLLGTVPFIAAGGTGAPTVV